MIRSILILTLMLAAGSLGACDQAGPSAANSGNGSSNASGVSRMPDPINLQGLKQRINQAAANDKILIIDFWATWCDPCMAIFDEIHALGEEIDGKKLIEGVVRIISPLL